ncbi:hypothetical protein, partial [Bradyrhizobium sp.]|uniref:hypothetical protein n=1 Tax=Bradyrhizobium sp. TaxID=376 RepID=UPI0025C45AA1
MRSDLSHRGRGGTEYFASLFVISNNHSFTISPHACAKFLPEILKPSRKRGRRECRAPNAPAAWQGRKTSHASKVTTVTPEITR